MEDELSLEEINNQLLDQSYVADRSITMSIYLALQLRKPLLIEGPAGVGKTEVAKVVAHLFNTELIRLQCYEGIDVNQAIYEWNYQHQLMFLKLQEVKEGVQTDLEDQLYSERFLLQRPIMQSILSVKRSVLLIDEIDRSDEAFESFLLEVLSDWQVTVPEIGTIKAKSNPVVILTSNATRELSEALRRRCLFLYIDFPDFEKELRIVREKIPNLEKALAQQVCRFIEELRKMKLRKSPGIAETLDWARALVQLHRKDLDSKLISETLGLVIKDWRDQREVQLSLTELLELSKVKSKV